MYVSGRVLNAIVATILGVVTLVAFQNCSHTTHSEKENLNLPPPTGVGSGFETLENSKDSD